MPEVCLNSRALGTKRFQPQPGAQECGFGLYLLSALLEETPPQGHSRWARRRDDGALSLQQSIKKGFKRHCVIPLMAGMLQEPWFPPALSSGAAEARATEGNQPVWAIPPHTYAVRRSTPTRPLTSSCPLYVPFSTS